MIQNSPLNPEIIDLDHNEDQGDSSLVKLLIKIDELVNNLKTKEAKYEKATEELENKSLELDQLKLKNIQLRKRIDGLENHNREITDKIKALRDEYEEKVSFMPRELTEQMVCTLEIQPSPQIQLSRQKEAQDESVIRVKVNTYTQTMNDVQNRAVQTESNIFPIVDYKLENSVQTIL